MFCSTKIFFTGIEWCSLDASFREPRESDKMVSLLRSPKGQTPIHFNESPKCQQLKAYEVSFISVFCQSLKIKVRGVFIHQVCYESFQPAAGIFIKKFSFISAQWKLSRYEVPSSMKINLFQILRYYKYFLGKLHQNLIGHDQDKNVFILSGMENTTRN